MPRERAEARKPPLDGSYAATVVLVLLALSPNIVVTTAISLVQKELAGALHASRAILELSPALSNAGYAFGAVLAADLYARFDPRRLFVFCECAFVAGALLSALAPDAAVFVAGRTLQGLSTGWMLVVAVPPLVNRFPPGKMPTTATTFLVGFFGAATVGPLIGGEVAHLGGFRVLFGILALVGAVNVGLVLLTVPAQKPPQPDLRFDVAGVSLAGAAMFLAFLGVWLLGTIAPTSPLGWGLIGLGVASLVAMLVVEYRAKEALVPVKPLSTSLPVLGIVCAMLSGAVFVALLELTETLLQHGRSVSPLATGLLFWPEVLGLVVAGLAFWRLFTTRWIPVLALAGMLALAIAGLLVAQSALRPDRATPILAIAGLLGLGAGLTVSPGLILAAFGVPSKQIGRTFALVELLRSSAAYLLGPVLTAFLAVQKRPPAMLASVHASAWICTGFMLAGAAGLTAMFVLTGVRLRAPDLQAWIGEGGQAMESPPVQPQLAAR